MINEYYEYQIFEAIKNYIHNKNKIKNINKNNKNKINVQKVSSKDKEDLEMTK